MGTSVQVFDSNMDAWKDAQREPWMVLRYRLAQANLHRHFGNSALHILDVGGGNGGDSLPLAAQGHTVTLVDYSAEMLADVRRDIETNGLSDRVTLIQADLVQTPQLFPHASFEVVFCHNVLQYIDEAATMLQRMSTLVKPGGLLSVISPNPASESLRVACQQHDLVAALANIDTAEAFTTLFGVQVHRYTVEDLSRWLDDAGCHVIGHYGIRCICDYLADNARKFDPVFFADLERLEYAMSDKHPYRLIGRFIHLIARREIKGNP
jgi:S-adenosylmethionine-dependent methyltransferase